jgi:hypothetical protein
MRTIATIATLVALFVLAVGAHAVESQWESQMTVAGFRITDIRGTANPDGSGAATGTLQMPSFGGTSVNLRRSTRGDVSGTAAIDAHGLRGSLTLSNGGLSGRGSVQCGSRTIENASISISPRGGASGSGRISLGRLNPSVDFTFSDSSCGFSGTAPARAQVDTAVASYKLDGKLSLESSGGAASAVLSGRVERTGKLANQVTSFNIPKTSVDISNGQCAVNVGGVSLTFTVF